MVKTMSMIDIRTQVVRRMGRLSLAVIMAAGLMIVVGALGAQEVHGIEMADGSSDDPYQITSYADLKEFAQIVNGTHASIEQNKAAEAKLMKNIDCDDSDWIPIGNSGNGYAGHFDGNKKIIKNLSNENHASSGNISDQGLFAVIDSTGSVENVGLEGGEIIGYDKIGGVAGSNNGTIKSCYNTGTVSGSDINVGGIAGYNSGTITDCHNTGMVSGGWRSVGGVVGFNRAKIINCYNSGAVSGSNIEVGGVAGNQETAGEITNCYNSGAVSGNDNYVGGVAGIIKRGKITSCYNCGTVSGSNKYVGGVAGSINSGGEVTNCYNSGAVSGSHSYVGGVAGSVDSGGEVTNCYYDTMLSGVTEAAANIFSSDTVKGLSTLDMTGDSAIGKEHMDFQYGEGEESPWLVKANGIDGASREYYEYYPHLKGFNLDSEGGQLDADKIAPADWPVKPHVHKVGDEKVYFMPWEKTDQLPKNACNYYLTGDVSLDSAWSPDGTVHLCLNDHGIEQKSDYTCRVMDVGSVGGNCQEFNLYDCGVTTRCYYIDDDGLGHIVASEEDDKYVNAEADQKGTFKGGFITGGDDGAVVFTSGGSFNMNGGTIIGNEADFGGAVDVYGGNFVMNGGNIIGNKAAYGGIAYVENAGNFTMNGGNIIANRSNIGGFYVTTNGNFAMNGGRITGNQVIRSEYLTNNPGGTIYITSNGNTSISLSGAPLIIGNKFGTDGEVNDIYLADGKTITITGKLQLPDGASTPQIGITKEGATVNGTKGVFTSGYSENNPGEDPGKYFISNDDSYAVYFDENKKEAQLIARTDISGGTCSFDEATYSGEEISLQTMTLKLSDTDIRELKLDTDYKITNYKDGNGAEIGTSKPKYAGTYKATVEGIGKYRGSEVVAFTIKPVPLTIKAKDQTYEYDGQPHGEGDPAYDDPAVIAGKVEAKGLQGSDVITSLVLDGAETEIGEYKDRIQITGFTINGRPEAKDNYNITLLPGTLTITKPQNSIVAPEPMTAGKNALTIHWRKVSGAQGYDIFFSICGKDTKCKLTKTIKGNKTFSWTKSGLKTKTPYKAYVKGWTMKDGKKIYISTSPTLHLYTANGTSSYTVAKSIKVKKTKVKLNAGKAYKIKAKIIKRDKTKKLMPATHTKQLRYISTNKKIATVSKSGKIKAKSKGNCRIYVYAANGVSKAVKVTVQ